MFFNRAPFRILAALALLLGGCTTSGVPGPHAAQYNWTSSFLSQVVKGQAMPAGVNDWGCRPGKDQNPVVLVHGTFSSTMYSFGALGPILANNALCVFAMDYGAARPRDWFKGLGPVDESARQVADFIESVKTATGSDKVTLVGHSQGGLLGFYYLKMLGGSRHVDRFVALAPSVNGTVIAKTPDRKLVHQCIACADQHPQSDLIRQLKDGPVTVPSVQYRILASRNDLVVVPVENQFVREPGVENIFIQDVFPRKRVSHSGMLYDADSLRLITRLIKGEPAAEPGAQDIQASSS